MASARGSDARGRPIGHLATRFFTSLRARPPAAAELRWVREHLSPPEWEVWCRLGTADRAEAITTARRLEARVARDPRWVAAALLHDTGKADAALGTIARAFATVVGWVRDPERVGGRTGRYLRHASIGADMLARAGARPEAVEWAAVHHHPERWQHGTIPPEVCEALARADGERPPSVK